MGKILNTQWCWRGDRSGLEWVIRVVWQRKGIRINTDEGRCPLDLGEDVH